MPNLQVGCVKRQPNLVAHLLARVSKLYVGPYCFNNASHCIVEQFLKEIIWISFIKKKHWLGDWVKSLRVERRRRREEVVSSNPPLTFLPKLTTSIGNLSMNSSSSCLLSSLHSLSFTLVLIYMKEVANDFGLIWNFAYVIYVKGTFNIMLSFKKTLSS